MKTVDDARLFLYNAAVVNTELARVLQGVGGDAELAASESVERSDELAKYVTQFSAENRAAAHSMAVWYILFYMLENDIRNFIKETLEEKSPLDWWEKCVPDPVKNEVSLNRSREQDMGLVPRSDEFLDYTTFGQLGEIMRANWDVFGGVISNQKAMSRVMTMLNALRGPIAHCGVLAEDEIDRLKLSVKDWFRLLAGPT